jgi:8-amino-7-oxononanoate synthase
MTARARRRGAAATRADGARPDLLARLAARSAERAQQQLLRRLVTVDAVDGPWLTLEGRRLLGFCSNDYLGLAGDARVRAALARAVAEHGVGSGAAHLVCGHHRAHAALEAELADWLGRERALCFSSGWMAALGCAGAVLERGDLSVQDKWNHASLLDAARYAGAELVRYPHADAGAAARQLATRGGRAALLASDGVFSMDGDVAPLAALAALAARERATLLIDDAHALGVLGPEGRGSVAEAGLGPDQVPVLLATLGKALGTGGAFIAGSHALIEGLLQFARPYVYTTAAPPALAAATLTALRIARTEDWRRQHLQALIERFKRGAAELGLALPPSRTPIQPLAVADAGRALVLQQALAARGVWVQAIRPPTVPSARLRITLSAAHGERDVDALLAALAAERGLLATPA